MIEKPMNKNCCIVLSTSLIVKELIFFKKSSKHLPVPVRFNFYAYADMVQVPP